VVEFLWVDAFALVIGAGVAILDVDFQPGGRKLGRPVYGALVLAGLLATYTTVVHEGVLPPPAWAVLVCAALYLPFLSTRFIDLETTDRHAREALQTLLLEREFAQLRHASGQGVLRHGRRRLRLHWECRVEEGELRVELDVHPSLLPVTVSRPHVAHVRSPAHLEHLRADIRRRRAAEGPAPDGATGGVTPEAD
jgi:hypothetical protein